MKNTLIAYANLKMQITALTEKAEDMLPDVLVALETVDPDNKGVEIEQGLFKRNILKSWNYSEEYEELKKKLDAQKKEEQREGTATYTEFESITFKAK